MVRYLMVIWADTDRAGEWNQLSSEEQGQAALPIHDWYETHSAEGRIQGGEELAWPRDRMSITKSADGPVLEHISDTSGTALSGVMTIEVESPEIAIEMAGSWPDLKAPGDRVDLIPIHTYDPT